LASASSCSYMAGMTFVIVMVDERGSAAAALQEYNTQLDNSRIREDRGEGKTVIVSGVGEGAFADDAPDGSMLGLIALHGSRVFNIGIMGAKGISPATVRSLMQTALSR
jgi:hypothetical protein